MLASATQSVLAAPSLLTGGPLLFIDVQHGLCNRLRALASATVLAKNSGRQLILVWCPDHHCQARVGDLLNYDGTVIEDPTLAAFERSRAARVYNYMEIEDGAHNKEPIDPRSIEGDIYVRSSDALVSPLVDLRSETKVLRGLRPCDDVLALVTQVPHPSDVAIHVRMGTGPAFDHLSYEAPANWPAERHQELTEWRKKSDVSRFVSRLDQLIEQGEARTIFAAADLSATYSALIERYGDRLRFLERPVFDRSAAQLQYALADLMLLASAPRFLASTWSSFSDVAQHLAPPDRKIERSGLDF